MEVPKCIFSLLLIDGVVWGVDTSLAKIDMAIYPLCEC